MNKITNISLKRMTLRGLLVAACIILLVMLPFSASTALAAAVNYQPVLTATPVSGTAPHHHCQPQRDPRAVAADNRISVKRYCAIDYHLD